MKEYSQTAKVKRYSLPLQIKKNNDWYLAFCPIWNDCYAQGKTIDQATAEAIAVASSLIELYQKEDLPIPLPLEKKALSEKISFKVPIYSSL